MEPLPPEHVTSSPCDSGTDEPPHAGDDLAPSGPETTVHAKRIEMMEDHEEVEEEHSETLVADYEQSLRQVRGSFDPPSPRTQTDLSGAAFRIPWIDHPSDELYWPITDTVDLGYRLYPTAARSLPGAGDEPLGLITEATVRPGDTYACDQPAWIPQYPDSHPTTLVDYDLLEEWLSQHLPRPEELDVLVIFTDTRPLHQVGAWQYTKRLWQHRFSKCGPHGERWQGLFVPLTGQTGLSEVQCTWGGVFVAEAICALRPGWHLLLSDTDVAPTALFEIRELLDLCGHIAHDALVEGEPGLLVGTEPHQDINAGMAIFPSTADAPKPGTLRRKVMAARRCLLEKPRVDLPDAPPALLPPVTLSEQQFRAAQSAVTHAQHLQMAALTRTPLAGIKAGNPKDYLVAWAILGTWTCTLVWPTPNSAKWPQACFPVNPRLTERRPYLGAWARSSFEQGALCALAAMSSPKAQFCALPGDACFQCHGTGPCVTDPPQATLPLFVHYYGNKDSIHELDRIQAMPTLAQSLFGHESTPPLWCQREWKVAADISITCSARQSPSWHVPQWNSVALSEDKECSNPYAVLASPGNIADGHRSSCLDVPMAAPRGAEVELGVTAVPCGTEVLHVYATGLNGGLPHDMPADHCAAAFNLRGAYGPSMSQMFSTHDGQSLPEGMLPRAPLRSHAEYIEFCRCLLDEAGHRCWRDLLAALGVDADDWIRYAARYATLPPLPAQLALPAPVWPIVSSTVLLYLQPALLAELAKLMHWQVAQFPCAPSAMHFDGYSAGSYTAIALEADYRLLSRRFQIPLANGTTTVGALSCPILYLLELMVPGLHVTEHGLVTDQRTLRITHVWEDKLCVWRPKLATLLAATAPLCPDGSVPALLIQVHEGGEVGWLDDDRHNYSHLLRVAVPSNPALLVVRASLKQLSAYTIDFVPLESLDELASYLLSWAATIAPFTTLSADQLRKAATSDRGALEAASTLLRRPPDGQLNADECCHTLIDNLCVAITTSRQHSKEAQVVTNIVRRFLGGLHLRQLVILLGRILPLLRSQATPGTTVIQASGRAAARAGPARIMHTMATISPAENEVICFAKSAELCGLRQFHLNFSPAVTSLAHFHPTRQPGPGSRPEGNTKFPVGTLLLLEVSFPAEHVHDAQRPMRNTLQGPACIRAQRGHHGFTLATVPVVLPMGPWPLAESFQSTGPIIQSLSADSPGSHSLLNQGQWTYMADTRDLLATQPGLLPFVVHQALCHQPRQKDLGHRKKAQDAHLAAPWALEGYFLDPVLFEMLAKMSRLTLPDQPFHVPVWRRASLHTFTLRLHHVMRVGHLESPMVWRSLLYPSPARLPLTWGITNFPRPMPHDLPSYEMLQTATWLVRALLVTSAGHAAPVLAAAPLLEEALPLGSQSTAWLPQCSSAVPTQLVEWLAAHSIGCSPDLHLLTMAVAVLLSLCTHKAELAVRGVYGAGKTQCIALLAAFFALRGHHVYYASRENTTILAMAAFVEQILPRAPDDEWPVAMRLLSQPQSRTEGTSLDARDADKNPHIWNAKLIMATTGLHLAQFQHKYRPLAKAVEYAELFIYDEAQQEAALSDLAILGALPRKCLVLRLGDPKQTSGGTGPSELARQVRLISDQLALGIRAPRTPYLPQALPKLIQSLLVDPLHTPVAVPSAEIPDPGLPSAHDGGALPCGSQPSHAELLSADAARQPLAHALMAVISGMPLRWHTAGDPDACAGETPPHNWSVMLPVSKRVQAGVYALMAVSRYRDALVLKPTLGRTLVYQPLVPKALTASFQVILVPPRSFHALPPVARDVYFAVALFLQQRMLYPELIQDHRGPGSLLLTPRLDSQAIFAKLIADIGVEGDIRYAQLARLLENGAPVPTAVTAQHVQALRADLRADTMSHAAGLTAHTAVLVYGKSGFLGRDESGHGRSTVGLTRARGTTIIMGPPDSQGLIGMVQAVLAYYFVAYCASWHLPEALPPLSPTPQDMMLRVRPLDAADWSEVPLAIQLEHPDGAVVLLRLTLKRRKLPHGAVDLRAPTPVFPRVVGAGSRHFHWAFCSPLMKRPVAWYGTNSAGAFVRVCHTNPKVRLRLPSQGTAEVHQSGYRLVLLPKLAFFALWDGVGEEYRVPRKPKAQPEVALPRGSQASAADQGNADLATSSVLGADPTPDPPKPPTASTHPVPPSPGSPGSPNPSQGDHKNPSAPAGDAADAGGLKEGTGEEEGDAAQEISSEEDSESAAETVESYTADPANDEAAPVVTAPDVDAVMAATHVAQVAGEAVHLPMITIKLDDRALAPAAPLVQVPYLERLLDAVRAGTPLVQLPNVMAAAAGQAYQDLATFITELVVRLFDPELLRGLQGPLAPYQALADRTSVHRAILAQMQYVADVAASLPQTSQSTSGGLFRFTWRAVRSYGLTLGLRTVFLYLPQPVAACMIVLPPGGSLPALVQVTLPVHPPHPFTYLAATWKVDMEHQPAPDFLRWYMSRVTCGPFLLEVCRRCKVCPNLVAHLQIPRLRISYQVAMPVVGRPGQHAVPRLPDGAVGKALLSQGWCPRQVLQMPRERSQPLVQEIPLAFRQPPATVLPAASPLLQDHDVVQSLHFYFLLARTPLSEVEVRHLTSPTRLVFGSAPIPKLPTKRPRQQPPTSLAALVSCLQRCRPMAPARAASGPPAPAASGAQPGRGP